jgi:anti-anti-sigma factor
MILRLIGVIDGHTCKQFAEAINSVIEKLCFKIVLDLTALEYLSSSGVGVISKSLNTVKGNNGNLVLMNPTQHVDQVLSLVGLPDVLPIVQDLPAAMAVFKGPRKSKG